MNKIITKIMMISILLFILDLSCEAFTIDSKVEAHDKTEQIKPKMVELERMFLDGDRSFEMLHFSFTSVNESVNVFSDWELIEVTEEKIHFKKYIDDISPLVKMNGYFGITEEGVLSIFNGEPNHKQLIQSFYQIDIEKLETKCVHELIKGIPVTNKQKYKEVIETYLPYVKEERG